jgi:hypothetical protein
LEKHLSEKRGIQKSGFVPGTVNASVSRVVSKIQPFFLATGQSVSGAVACCVQGNRRPAWMKPVAAC